MLTYYQKPNLTTSKMYYSIFFKKKTLNSLDKICNSLVVHKKDL